ncbi:MAG: hypothetical protein M1833_004355 [Piccolia ochrophora]|nr:MAG: hypothetical protein M1833_004355 [Piccolia ochrophora]
MPRCGSVDIEEASIDDLQEHMTRGRFSARELTECYLKRITRVNRYTKSVIEVNPMATEIANSLDHERRRGGVRGKLHGIPFLVKDNIATKDQMETTAGSSMLIGTIVPEDAHVVALLRDAGAILLGHANMSEWACMRSTSEGYSSRGGQGRNPYNLAENPGGSSSGSAGAVACNMCVFSLGTETDGSILFPADRNGVVGIKPTVSLTSRRGLVPAASSLDTLGPLSRSVADAAIVLGTIAEYDLQDRSTAKWLRPTSAFFEPCLRKQTALKGVSFGLPAKRVWEAAASNPDVKYEYRALRFVAEQIRGAGAEVLEGTDFPSWEELVPPDGWDWDYGAKIGHPEHSEFTVVKVEFYNEIKKYLQTLGNNKNNILSLEKIVEYNRNHTATEGGLAGTHPAWPKGQDNFEMSLDSEGIEDDTYTAALEYIQFQSRIMGIDGALASGGRLLDGLLVPILADGGVACQVAAKAGYPMISIPVGVNDTGVPFGIGIIQSAWREDLLIKYGSAIEDLIRGRRSPTFLNPDADNYMYVGNP